MKTRVCSKVICLVGFVIMFVACEDEVVDYPPNRIIPVISSFTVSPNVNCVLSASARVGVVSGSSVSIEYSTDSISFQSTPRFSVTDTSVYIPILGLRPDTTYVVRAKAFSQSGDSVLSSFVILQTDTLPAGLPDFVVNTSQNPSPGYVMLGLTPIPSGPSAAVIVNNDGEIVWYRKFDGPVTDFQRQPHGKFTAYSTLAGFNRFFEMDVLGNTGYEYIAQTTPETGVHELRVVGAFYYLYATDFRTMDLTGIGGLNNARVRGMTIEGNTTRGAPWTWSWSTFDHFQVTDARPDISLTGANVNQWHANAIEIDTDGNILVSFRNMDEVTKINTQTGAIIWRLGGENNQFTFINDPSNGFSHQHGVRRLSNGNIILFDNGNLHVPPVSRAVEYRVDENALTAEMVWEYRNSPPLYASALGFAHRNDNGNTLICYGTVQKILEVDASGTVLWDLSTVNNFPYRAFRISSLY